MEADIVLPSILLMLAFFLKLFIDREVDIPNIIYALFELPVDVLLLATSFIIAFTIAAKPPETILGFMYFCSYIVVAVLTVFIWRKACRFFEGGYIKTAIFISVLNYTFCAVALFRAIRMI